MKCFAVIQSGFNMLTTSYQSEAVHRKQQESQETEFSDTAGPVKFL